MDIKITYTKTNPTIFDYRSDLAKVAVYLFSQTKTAPKINFMRPDKAHMYYFSLLQAMEEAFASVVKIETPLCTNITLHKLGAKDQLIEDTSLHEGWLKWNIPKHAESAKGILPSIGRTVLAAQVLSTTYGFALGEWPSASGNKKPDHGPGVHGWGIPKKDSRVVYKSSADQLARNMIFDVHTNGTEAWIKDPPKILYDFMQEMYPADVAEQPKKTFLDWAKESRAARIAEAEGIFNLD